MKDIKDIDQLAHKFLSTYLDPPYKVTKAKLGNANANFIVEHGDKKYFFRVYLPVKDFPRKVSDIEKEMNVIEWFSEKGFPVAKAIPNRDGAKFIESNGSFGALFEHIDGIHAYGNLSSAHFFEVGRLMGKVHKETEATNLKCDKKWEDGNFWKRVFRKVEENKSLLDDSDLAIYKSLLESESRLENVEQYLIHGDYHYANMLFGKYNKIVGLLDFDDYRMGHFMDDAVRCFVCELIYTPKEYYSLKHEYISAFWSGYFESRQLPEEEIELIPIYIDLHYLSGLISIKKKDIKKVEEFKMGVDELKLFTFHQFK